MVPVPAPLPLPGTITLPLHFPLPLPGMVTLPFPFVESIHFTSPPMIRFPGIKLFPAHNWWANIYSHRVNC
uniref:Uncharacterized protein n=1 Tax=Arundo donax TaxID=35708 RepID=A0A0A9DRI1_ARUDO